MRRWAVTGPIGAGKSTVAALLAARGAAVVDGDLLGHEILARPAIAAAVAAEFGAAAAPHGAVDRSVLGRIVFSDASAMARLNALTHQPLADLATARLDELERAGGHVLAVLEAAVYFLLPSPPRVELVVVVTATAANRVARLSGRRGLAEAEALARVAAQSGMTELWQHADVTIANDGTARDLADAVADLWCNRGLPDSFPAPREDNDQ